MASNRLWEPRIIWMADAETMTPHPHPRAQPHSGLMCGVNMGGWVCTLEVGHFGTHIAGGSPGMHYAEWADRVDPDLEVPDGL